MTARQFGVAARGDESKSPFLKGLTYWIRKPLFSLSEKTVL
jgi:hypothetical protein